MAEWTGNMEMEAKKNKPMAPLQIHCTVCGAPAEFDIIRQNYNCQSCGAFIGIDEPRIQLNGWQELRQKELRASIDQSKYEVHSCQNCGAQIVIPAGEALGACEFCGGKVVTRTFQAQEDFPEVVIPFYLTLEEARNQLKKWADDNKTRPEADTVRSKLKNLRGYYLPYQLVKGPMSCRILRDQTFSDRSFVCKSYLQGLVVNTSAQFNNEVLNAAEPFDWNGLRSFEFGYVAGQKTKLADVTAAEALARIENEVAEDYRPVVEKTLETTGLSLHVKSGNLLTVSALLPMYILGDDVSPEMIPDAEQTDRKRKKKAARSGRPKMTRLWAVVNGQTGRVAVQKQGELKKSYPWLIEPTLMTLVTAAVFTWLFWPVTSLALMVTLVFAIIYFVAYSDGRGAEFRKIIFQSEEGRASRTGRTLQVASVKNKPSLTGKIAANMGIISNSRTGKTTANQGDTEYTPQYGGTELHNVAAPPVFFEDVNGKSVPVMLQFYTPLRILFTLGFVVLVNILPQALAGLALLTGLAVPPVEWNYGFGWLVLSVPVTVILWIAIGRIRIYNHPLVRQILADGTTRVVEADIDKDNSIAKNVKDILELLFMPGLRWATIGVLVILLGFTLAILF